MAREVTSRSGFAALVLGAMLLAELAVTSLLFTADQDFVYFLGHRINYVCAARQRYGIPCPTCGLTRGFVLTVHGKPGTAWRLSPTGPLTAVGMFGMGVMLLIYAALQRRRGRVQLSRMPRYVKAGALAYASVGTLIWAVSWVTTVIKMRGHPF
jgi:hypothetical protein